jgi:formylglycine-generating enzyme required for sulfatase activity
MAYTWGDDPHGLKDHAWFEDNSGETTHPVASKMPNPWGLYDMYGNVAEWCLDHYYPDTYGLVPVGDLAFGPVRLPTADRYPHVVRGGSWVDTPAMCRSAARRGSDKRWNRSDPGRPQSIWWQADADFVGFRIVRAVEEQKSLKHVWSQVTKDSP